MHLSSLKGKDYLVLCFNNKSIMDLSDIGVVYRHGMNNAELIEIARIGTIYEENGLYGMKDAEGMVVFPPQYLFIGICPEHILFINPQGKYEKIFSHGSESGFMPEEERPFVMKGKAGMKQNGEVIIPAEYEYISRKFGDSVFYAVKDGREMYLNDEGKEVLTRVRRFESERL